MGNNRMRLPYPLARIQAAMQSHRITAAFLSLILVSVMYGTTSIFFGDSSSPYSAKKRYGVGGRDAHGELASTLRRKENGRAAVAIVRVVGMSNLTMVNPQVDVQYLVQLKSHDYPIPDFRGAVCLLGGNANGDDASPLETLKRELREELYSPNWVDGLLEENIVDDSTSNAGPQFNATAIPRSPGTIRYLGTTKHSQTAELIKKRNPYDFMCALYEVTIRAEQLPPSVLYPRGANVQEGRMALLSQEQLIRHAKYSWGYEFTMAKYFGRNRTQIVCPGATVSDVDQGVWSKEKWATP